MLTNVFVHKPNAGNWRVIGKLPDGTVLGVINLSVFDAKGKHGYFINGIPVRIGTGMTSSWHKYAKYWPELIRIGKESE